MPQLVLTILLLLGAASASAADGRQLFSGTLDAVPHLDAPPPSHAPLIDRLDSGLSRLLREHRRDLASTTSAPIQSAVQIEIYLDARARNSGLGQLGSLATVTKQRTDGSVLQAWAMVENLEAIAAIDGVENVRRPFHARSLGGASRSIQSEGTELLDVATWHAAGVRGQGVLIGIIDVGFVGYEDLLGIELPAEVSTRSFVDGEENDLNGLLPHGTAVAEVIHDLAPNADLALARIDTIADFEAATRWMIDDLRVDIISTSLGFLIATPGDGTGLFSELVTEAVDRGIFWATAAGNSRESHWSGPFDDLNENNRLDFNGFEINWGGPANDDRAFLIGSGFTFWVFVRWDDWERASQDYDVILYRFDGDDWRRLDASGGRDRQRGRSGDLPIEIAGAETTGEETAYGFEIRRVSGDREVNFDVFTLLEISETESADVPLNQRVAMRSLPSLADSPDAVTVAAVEAFEPFLQEPFSSEGPTNGPGGRAAGGLAKPDIAAFDGVSTDSYGPRGFFGTSAATPHVAGIAALVRGAQPDWSPQRIREFLEERAIDLGPAGRDHQYGLGLLNLGPPPVTQPTDTPTRTPTPTITRTPTITLTPSNTPTPGPCYGDCNSDGMISIAELIVGVRISLGFAPASSCPAHDHDRNGLVAVSELIKAVRAALFRCIGQP